MRTTRLAILLLFVVNISFGQKAKIKNKGVKAHINTLPEIGFDKSIISYYVVIEGINTATLQRLGYTLTRAKEGINIGGYQRMEEPIGAKITLTFDGPSGSPLKLKSQAKKDKQGKKWTEYKYAVKFQGSVNYKVSDEQGTTIFEDIYQIENTEESPTYRSKAKLKDEFDSSKFYLSHREDLLKNLLAGAGRKLNAKFGYSPYKKKIDFKRLATKKHPAYKSWKEKEEKLEGVFELITPADNSKYVEAIAEFVVFWKSEEPKYSFDDKHGKKLKYAALKNLSLAHIYIGDLEMAREYAQQIVDSGHEKKDGEKLLAEIDDIDKKLKKLELSSMYVKIDDSELEEIKAKKQEEISAAIESGDITQHPDYQTVMELTDEKKLVQGTMYNKSGKSTDVHFVYIPNQRGLPDWRYPSKVKFAKLEEGRLKRQYPNLEALDSIRIDTSVFYISDVTIGSGLTKLKVKNAIIETVMHFDKTSLNIITPPFAKSKKYGQSNEVTSQLAIYKNEDQKYYPPEAGMLSSFDKGMKNIVGSCEAALEYLAIVKANRKHESLFNKLAGFDNSEEIMEVLKLYDTCN